MSEAENIRVSDEAFAALNAHDLNRFAQYLADDFQGTVPDVPGTLNKQQYLDYVRNYLTGFPDMRIQVDRNIAKDETVVALWSATGTHTGPLNGPSGVIPPTGKKFTGTAVNVEDNRNGKLVRVITSYDLLALLQQLGLVPG